MKIIKARHNFSSEKDTWYYREGGYGYDIITLAKTPMQKIFIDGVEHRLGANQISYFRARDPYVLYIPPEGCQNDWFSWVADEQSDAFLARLGIESGGIIDVPNPMVLSEIIRNMSIERNIQAESSAEIMEYYFYIFFCKLAQGIKIAKRIGRQYKYFEEFSRLRSEIYSRPNKRWKLDELAARMFISRSHFQHSYSAIFGCSLSGDIINARIQHAKELLASSASSAASIAEACGYNSEVHFTRQFKEKTGITPGKYRGEFKRRRQ